MLDTTGDVIANDPASPTDAEVRHVYRRDQFEHDWLRERWSRGCYVGIMPPGVMLDYGHTLRPPIGRVHWAGTETATRGAGYMDGAVQSGERAAAEVLARL